MSMLMTAALLAMNSAAPVLTLPTRCENPAIECIRAHQWPVRWNARAFDIDYNTYPDPPTLPAPWNYGKWATEAEMLVKRHADATLDYCGGAVTPCEVIFGEADEWGEQYFEGNGFIRRSNSRKKHYHVPGGATCFEEVHNCGFKELISAPITCPQGWSGGGNDPQIGYYCYRTRKENCGVCTKAGNPIDVFFKNKVQLERDWSRGLLKVERRYRSDGFSEPAGSGTHPHPLGHWWKLNYTSKIVATQRGGTPVAILDRDTGETFEFSQMGDEYLGSADAPGSLRRLTDGSSTTGWVYESKGGEIETYSALGQLLSMHTRVGQSISIEYDANNLIAVVTDETGRSLTYGYDSRLRLESVMLPDGSQITYEYKALLDQGENVWKAHFPDGTSRTYNYDFPSYYATLLTSIVDESGVEFATYTYDSNAYPMSSSHVGGVGTVQVATGLPSNKVGFTDSLGTLHTFTFRTVANALRVEMETQSCEGCVARNKSIHYDAAGNIEYVIDFNGNKTTYTYDPLRFMETSRTEASTDGSAYSVKRTIETDYHPDDYVPAERRTYNANSVLEARQQWAYNARGQAIAVCQIDPADPVAMSYTCSAAVAPPADAKVQRTVNTYCESSDVSAGICPLEGLLIQANGPRLPTDPGTNGLDDITTYTYRMQDDPTCASNGACTYRKGDLWKVTNALGQVTETVKYDKAGRPTRIKDANGTLTDMVYHPRGWLTDRIVRFNVSGFPSSNDATTHIDYYPTGDVMKVTQPDGAFLAYTYDDAHRLIRITDTLGNTIDYCPGGVGSADCLDAAGNRRVEQIKDPGGAIKRSLRRTYNQLGQLTATLNAASQATLSYPASDGYDPNGNPTHSEDGLGIETRQEYDPLNRLKTTIQDYLGTDPETANATTGYTYDARDNLRQVTDPENLNTVYDYDGLNNLTGLHSPDTGDTTYTYDLAGNRITQTDARNVTSTYSYDALNRLTAITYPTTAKNLSYAYDQPDSVTGCIGSYPLGRLTRITDESGTTTYCYDRRGNVLRKVQVTALDTLVLAYTWTLADRLSSITYPSGRIVSYARNGIGQITSVTMQQSAGAPAEVLISAASYYPFGPLNELTFGNGRSLSKTYDGDYAIDSVASSDPNGLVLDFSTDVMGNITAASNTLGASTPTRQYDYDALYRLTEVRDASNAVLEHYAYSKTGDRTQRTLAGQAPQSYAYVPGTHRLASIDGQARSYDANGNTTLNPDALSSAFIYDDRNRLSQIPGVSSAQYRYNARGERVGKLHTMGYLGGNERISAYDEQGKLMSYVDYRINNLGKRTLAGSHDLVYLDDLPVALLGKGATRYLETDHLGTPRLASNAKTGTTDWQWDFLGDGFGANDASVIDADADLPLRYPGQQYDAESGLHYNYFRDYEPGTGRYVESDPIGLLAGMNTYSYALNNPIFWSDGLGLDVDINLFPPGSDAYNFARNYPGLPTECTIAGHGTPRTLATLSPGDVAKLIPSYPRCHNKPIRLIACNTGVRPPRGNPFGKDLAKNTGQPVFAPNNWGWLHSDGRFGIGPANPQVDWRIPDAEEEAMRRGPTCECGHFVEFSP